MPTETLPWDTSSSFAPDLDFHDDGSYKPEPYKRKMNPRYPVDIPGARDSDWASGWMSGNCDCGGKAPCNCAGGKSKSCCGSFASGQECSSDRASGGARPWGKTDDWALTSLRAEMDSTGREDIVADSGSIVSVGRHVWNEPPDPDFSFFDEPTRRKQKRRRCRRLKQTPKQIAETMRKIGLRLEMRRLRKLKERRSRESKKHCPDYCTTEKDCDGCHLCGMGLGAMLGVPTPPGVSEALNKSVLSIAASARVLSMLQSIQFNSTRLGVDVLGTAGNVAAEKLVGEIAEVVSSDPGFETSLGGVLAKFTRLHKKASPVFYVRLCTYKCVKSGCWFSWQRNCEVVDLGWHIVGPPSYINWRANRFARTVSGSGRREMRTPQWPTGEDTPSSKEGKKWIGKRVAMILQRCAEGEFVKED